MITIGEYHYMANLRQTIITSKNIIVTVGIVASGLIATGCVLQIAGIVPKVTSVIRFPSTSHDIMTQGNAIQYHAIQRLANFRTMIADVSAGISTGINQVYDTIKTSINRATQSDDYIFNHRATKSDDYIFNHHTVKKLASQSISDQFIEPINALMSNYSKFRHVPYSE
jgi:hypothetical protein